MSSSSSSSSSSLSSSTKAVPPQASDFDITEEDLFGDPDKIAGQMARDPTTSWVVAKSGKDFEDPDAKIRDVGNTQSNWSGAGIAEHEDEALLLLKGTGRITLPPAAQAAPVAQQKKKTAKKPHSGAGVKPTAQASAAVRGVTMAELVQTDRGASDPFADDGEPRAEEPFADPDAVKERIVSSDIANIQGGFWAGVSAVAAEVKQERELSRSQDPRYRKLYAEAANSSSSSSSSAADASSADDEPGDLREAAAQDRNKAMQVAYHSVFKTMMSLIFEDAKTRRPIGPKRRATSGGVSGNSVFADPVMETGVRYNMTLRKAEHDTRNLIQGGVTIPSLPPGNGKRMIKTPVCSQGDSCCGATGMFRGASVPLMAWLTENEMEDLMVHGRVPDDVQYRCCVMCERFVFTSMISMAVTAMPVAPSVPLIEQRFFNDCTTLGQYSKLYCHVPDGKAFSVTAPIAAFNSDVVFFEKVLFDDNKQFFYRLNQSGMLSSVNSPMPLPSPPIAEGAAPSASLQRNFP